MSEASGVDPEIFEKRNEVDFCLLLCEAATSYVEAGFVIQKYESEHSAEAAEGMVREVKELQPFKDLANIIGEDMAMSVAVSSTDDPEEEADYNDALVERAESVDVLVGNVLGYGNYMQDNLMQAYGGDEAEALPAAWGVAWCKLRDALKPMGGIYLAEVADMFDDIIGWKYEGFYDHTDRLRGAVVAEDLAARAFYEVMEPHLTRSIVKRGDDWSR